MSIKIGISTCLLGEKVRYDGGHKASPFCQQQLGPLVEYVSVCPEMAIGMKSPRPAIRLQQDDQLNIRLVQSSDSSIDINYVSDKVCTLSQIQLKICTLMHIKVQNRIYVLSLSNVCSL